MVVVLSYKGKVDKLNGTKNLPMTVGITVLFLKNGIIPKTSFVAPLCDVTGCLIIIKKVMIPTHEIKNGSNFFKLNFKCRMKK